MANQIVSYFVDWYDKAEPDHTPNFLFRGDTPDIDPGSGFDYGCLRDAISTAATNAKIILPDNYYLVDICLLQTANSGEVPSIVAEYEYFQKHPDEGQAVYWSTEGVGLDPYCIDDLNQRNYLVTTLGYWLPDPLVDRISSLRSWLEGTYQGTPVPLAAPVPSGPVVFYVHCNGGCDRTGEIIAAYAMHYLSKTWLAANADNYECCYGGQQPFGCDNYFAARWYCLYLAATTGQDPGCSETPPNYPNYGPCNRGNPPQPNYPCPPLTIFPCP